jgi:hypothetical protein
MMRDIGLVSVGAVVVAALVAMFVYLASVAFEMIVEVLGSIFSTAQATLWEVWQSLTGGQQ